MKSTKSNAGNFAAAKLQADSRRLLVIVLAALLGFSMAAYGDDSDDDYNLKISPTSGRLTITGLGGYNGSYVIAISDSEDGTLIAADSISSTSFSGSTISGGKVTLKVWEETDYMELGNFNGSGVKEFDVAVLSRKTISEDDEYDSDDYFVAEGTVMAIFTRGTGAGEFEDLSMSSAPESGKNDSALSVWSYTDELEDMVRKYYKPAHPNAAINYSYTPTEQLPNRLDAALASGQKAPDIFTLEFDFVRKYVESGLLLDLTDIYEANKNKFFTYPVEAGSYNGRVYALSWQAVPGAMFYRRSLAKKYLGTDDPKVVQTYFANLGKFKETAKLLKDKSGGRCVVVSSFGDIMKVFLALRKNPWIVNNKLVIDPVMEEYMDTCKTMYDNRWEGRVGQWSEGWFEGMRDEFHDDYGNRQEVFSYFLPTWGLHYVLKTNAYNTEGDWAMIPGPVPWYWGGTWIGAWKDTKHLADVKEFIRYLTTDDGFLERWARDTGDMVNNINVINKIKNNFSEPFLGGQNHYAEFAEMAKGINGRLTQATDSRIESYFYEEVKAFAYGEKTKARALADFRAQIKKELGLLSTLF